ncbi:MAG: DUF2437 domain-containing protein, partial [Acidobacteriia bacterium]|nr:DUF2437 domain-containing protein [Terriglobia bacterium]
MAKFIRYRQDSSYRYGIVEDSVVHEIQGSPYGEHRQTGVTQPLEGLEVVNPCEPTKVIAVGRNYKSHLGNRTHPQHPEIFYKPLTA